LETRSLARFLAATLGLGRIISAIWVAHPFRAVCERVGPLLAIPILKRGITLDASPHFGNARAPVRTKMEQLPAFSGFRTLKA
jgi:hypothetical protein